MNLKGLDDDAEYDAPDEPEPVHGYAMYVHQKCRCFTCTAAASNHRYSLLRRHEGPPGRRRLKYPETVPPKDQWRLLTIPSDVIPAPEDGWWTELGRE